MGLLDLPSVLHQHIFAFVDAVDLLRLHMVHALFSLHLRQNAPYLHRRVGGILSIEISPFYVCIALSTTAVDSRRLRKCAKQLAVFRLGNIHVKVLLSSEPGESYLFTFPIMKTWVDLKPSICRVVEVLTAHIAPNQLSAICDAHHLGDLCDFLPQSFITHFKYKRNKTSEPWCETGIHKFMTAMPAITSLDFEAPSTTSASFFVHNCFGNIANPQIKISATSGQMALVFPLSWKRFNLDGPVSIRLFANLLREWAQEQRTIERITIRSPPNPTLLDWLQGQVNLDISGISKRVQENVIWPFRTELERNSDRQSITVTVKRMFRDFHTNFGIRLEVLPA